MSSIGWCRRLVTYQAFVRCTETKTAICSTFLRCARRNLATGRLQKLGFSHQKSEVRRGQRVDILDIGEMEYLDVVADVPSRRQNSLFEGRCTVEPPEAVVP